MEGLGNLNPAAVYMPRPVKADFFVFINLYDPTILNNQGNSSKTN
jgi:hypothetical protein